MVRRAFATLLLLLPCAGCTTLTAGQCLHANWYETGYLAGASGKPPSEALKLQNACVQYGIVPDRQAFASGWVVGAGAAR